MKKFKDLMREKYISQLEMGLDEAGFGDIDPLYLDGPLFKLSFLLTRDPVEFNELVTRRITFSEDWDKNDVRPPLLTDLRAFLPEGDIDADAFHNGDWDVDQRYLFRDISQEWGGEKHSGRYLGYCPENFKVRKNENL